MHDMEGNNHPMQREIFQRDFWFFKVLLTWPFAFLECCVTHETLQKTRDASKTCSSSAYLHRQTKEKQCSGMIGKSVNQIIA